VTFIDAAGGGAESVPIPDLLIDATRNEDRGDWLDRLPSIVGEAARRWSLDVGRPFEPGGQTAWVAPVRTVDGDAVLKVGWWHFEADHEADGLRVWDGDGAIRVLEAARIDDSSLLLLERCEPGTPLSSRPGPEQDAVITSLLRRLWREPALGQPFRSLQSMCDVWADEAEVKIAQRRVAIDPGLARAGVDLFRSLPASADRNVLLCTDLHARNVLSASREPWLMIDPKPYVGDPTYDVLQHLLNRRDSLLADPRGLAARIAELAELDRDRTTVWLFARCVQESPHWPELVEIARRLAP
jgi:streptomycin 6-kinase